jgi:hypothetical protein
MHTVSLGHDRIVRCFGSNPGGTVDNVIHMAFDGVAEFHPSVCLNHACMIVLLHV